METKQTYAMRALPFPLAGGYLKKHQFIEAVSNFSECRKEEIGAFTPVGFGSILRSAGRFQVTAPDIPVSEFQARSNVLPTYEVLKTRLRQIRKPSRKWV